MSIKNTPQSLKQIMERSVEEVIDETHLNKMLLGRRKLRVKLGIDPTSPDIHLGHTIPLLKLRHFQELGHTAVIIIGDYTASIGDPSGKDKTRPPLSLYEAKKNSATYKKQILKILREQQTEFHTQSEWFAKFRLSDVISLMSRVSVSYLLSHETFRDRLKKEQPFMAHEALYPLLQGYDSIAIKADVEIGAAEQKFNVLTGRMMQKQAGMKPQDIILTPYLLGTDGKRKMSKSLGNYIGLSEDARTMYGKLMSIPDTLIVPYFVYLTTAPKEELDEISEQALAHPRDTKARLARTLTAFYCGERAARQASKEFQNVFAEKSYPAEIPSTRVASKATSPLDFLVLLNLVASKSEARRMIEQGGVFVNNKPFRDWKTPITPKDGDVVRIGRRRIIQVRLQ